MFGIIDITKKDPSSCCFDLENFPPLGDGLWNELPQAIASCSTDHRDGHNMHYNYVNSGE